MRIYFLTETLQSMHPDMMKDELLTEVLYCLWLQRCNWIGVNSSCNGMGNQYAELKASLEEARIENSQLFNECQAAYDRVAELEADNQEREKEMVDDSAQTEGEAFEVRLPVAQYVA